MGGMVDAGGRGVLDEKAAELSTEDMFLVKLKLQETGQQFRVSDNRGCGRNLHAGWGWGGVVVKSSGTKHRGYVPC